MELKNCLSLALLFSFSMVHAATPSPSYVKLAEHSIAKDITLRHNPLQHLVKGQLAERKQLVRECYQQSLDRGDIYEGKLEALIYIDEFGLLRFLQLNGDSKKLAEVGSIESCLRAKFQLETWTPAPQGQWIKIHYPFHFKAKRKTGPQVL